MENLLHFGIDKKAVEGQYNKILKIAFPQVPKDDMLYDLYAELVEIDGYIMGVVSTYLKSGEIKVQNLTCDESFVEIYEQLNLQSKELEEILRYKKELDELVFLYEGKQ